MPIVHSLKANKDYPTEGIQKGDQYFKWSTRVTSGKSYLKRIHRSKVRPRASQLTSSDYKGQAHRLNETIEDLQSFDGLSDVIETLSDDAGSLMGEQEEKLDNMAHLRDSPTGEIIQERIDALEAFIGEVESIDVPGDELGDEPEPSDYSGGFNGTAYQDALSDWSDRETEWTDALDAAQSLNLEVG